jgi:trigger factor
VKSDIETLSPTRVKLTVEVPFEELEPSIEAAYGRIAKQVNVPGFRKGKVPARIIEQRFGRGAVLEEAVNEAVPRAYEEALRTHDIIPLSQPHLHLDNADEPLQDGASLCFTAEVDVMPDFDVPEYSSITVTVESPAPSDEDIDTQIDQLRGRFASLNDVERAAADGDVLLVDIAGATPEGDAVEDLVGNALSYELGTDGMLPGFDDAVRGAAAGETRTFEFTPQNGDWSGIALTVTVTVSAVRERILPPLDDDFAQLASEFDTVAELRDDMRDRLTRLGRLEQGNEARTKVLETLLASVDVPMPENLIASEVEEHFADGHDSGEEHRREVEEQTRENLKSQFILDKIAQKEQVSVGETELSAWLIQQAPRYGMNPEQFAQALVEAGQVPMAMQDIRRAKALALVLESVTVVDEDGNAVDLKALDAELNAAMGMGMGGGMGNVVEVDDEIDVYTDEDGNVIEVDETITVVED